MPALRPGHLRSPDPTVPKLAKIFVPTTGMEEVFDWHTEFGRTGPLKVEIGPGKGIWLTRMAALEPQSCWVGIEYKEKRARWVAEKVARKELGNIRVIWEDAAEALSTLFEPGEVDEIHINFPDPWPKRRHVRRRLLQAPFCVALARALRPGGLLQIVTDHAAYSGWIVSTLEQIESLENLAGTAGSTSTLEGYVPSIHFEKFAAQGRFFHFVRYRKL